MIANYLSKLFKPFFLLLSCLLFFSNAYADVLKNSSVNASAAKKEMGFEANIYTPASLNKKEHYLQTIAQNLASYKFVLLRAGNTTPTAWKIQNNTGENIALLKCTSGNNYAHAEVATYYLGKKLNFPIYPVTIGVTLNKSLADKLHLNSRFCALKEWVSNYSILYWKSQANLEKIVKQNQYSVYKFNNTFLSATGDRKKLADTLICQNDLASARNDFIELFSGVKTKNGDPLNCDQRTFFVTNKAPLLQVAKDFSNLMLIDVLIGNEDRFPGANLEFRSCNNQTKKLDNQTVMIINPRLSSLDTGAAFKGWPTTWARHEMRYYLRRFDPDMISRLKILLNQLQNLTPADLKGEWSFLNFTTQKNPNLTAVNYLKNNIQWVLDFVNSVNDQKNKEYIPGKSAQCKEIWLK